MGRDHRLRAPTKWVYGVRRREALLVTLALASSPFTPLAPAGAAAPAAPPAAPGARSSLSPGLSVVSGGTTETGAPNVARQDLGVVDGSTQPVLQAVFVLRNIGRDPVTLTDLQTSCGCASALLGAGGTSTLPETLAPGQETRVQATVRLQALDGPITKLVWIYTRGSALPALTLEIAATVLHAVTFSTRLLDFGVVPAGRSPAQPLTVTVDRRLLGNLNVLPALVSSNPDVRVVPPREPNVAAAPADTSGPVLVRTYSVVLSPRARLGRLFGTLSLAGSSAGPVVFFSGEVIGAVSAAPGVVQFGAVPAGQAATARVRLTFAAAAALRRARIICASPWLSARLRPSGGEAAVLEVVLGARTPPGALRSTVTVITGAGERLALPVTAGVARGARDHPTATR
jgi:uncharacterized protein DUF1573